MTRTIKYGLISILLVLLIMVSTNPTKLPSIMLVVPFVLLFVALSLGLYALLRSQSATKAKSIRISMMGAGFPMLMLVMQSLGQLTIRDLLTIVALFGIAYFYTARITRRASS
jgi:hypothetical protein